MEIFLFLMHEIYLKKLKIDVSNEYYTSLEEQLFKFNSKEEYWIKS